MSILSQVCRSRGKPGYELVQSPDPNRSVIVQEYEATKSALRGQAEIAVALAKNLQKIEELLKSDTQSSDKVEKERQLLNKIGDIRDTADRLMNRTSVLFESYDRLGDAVFGRIL